LEYSPNMPKTIVYGTVDGTQRSYVSKKPGPKPSGWTKRLFRLPPEYIAAMEAINDKCGGGLSVNEQVRRAVRAYLTVNLSNPIYIDRVNT
jgi:hypothetical protein